MPAMAVEEIRIGELAVRFLIEGDESRGSVALFEFTVPSRARVPVAHSHDAYEETVYGLEGTLTWTVDGERHEVGPGEALCIRRGVVHRFENEGEATRECLPSSRRACSAPAISAHLLPSSTRPWLQAARRTPPASAR